MNALVITLTTSNAWVMGLVLIAVGAFLQYWVGLELDDRADAKDELERDQDQSLEIAAYESPVQHADDPAHRGRRIVFPAQRDGGAS